jgi:D-alanine-D-alanine ligase
MSSRAAPKVAVLMGGISAEREVSLSTGRMCAAALREAGFEVVEVDAGRDLASRLAVLAPDVAFNALHGPFGEDGCVQGLLEWLGIPYTHSGVLASALAMDKARAREIFRAQGLPVAEGRLVHRDEIASADPLPRPYVIKPNDEGSSVGIYILREGTNRPDPSDLPEWVLVEAYVPGRELTASVLGDRALTVTEIVTDGWYDYEAKYAPGGSRHVCPAALPGDVFQACLDMALIAHRALGCRGLSRTDFRWDDRLGAAGLVVLELNTQPGMTPTSLSPEQASAVGIPFAGLCRWLVEDASCRR